MLLDLFSSVRFGIVLLAILFVYCSVGSAGVLYPIHPAIFHREAWVHAQLRQFRPFEMTEFEWFHWWPFNLLVALICVTMVVTTIRRIRFNAVNLGVWTIHTGIVVLALGSVVYFVRKIEGDVPVARRQVVATVPAAGGERSVSLVAAPGNRATIEADGARWDFEIASIDPSWEIRSGDDEGSRAYSVNVLVQGPSGRFMRQLLAGHPEYTEDVVFTDDPHQPMQRAIRATGKALLDESLRLELDYEPATHFYLKNDAKKSWAIYLRPLGSERWFERPVEGLPLYNDYIRDRDDVIQSPGDRPLPIDPIDVRVAAVDPEDPFPEVAFRINGYLRYAMTRTQVRRGGADAPLNPAIWMTLGLDETRRRDYRMLAMDPLSRRADEGLLAFRWAESEAALDAMTRPPTLDFEIPALDFRESRPITDLLLANPQLEFTPLVGPQGDTGYAYRVRSLEDDVPLASGVAAVVILELRTPAGEFRRWVFDAAGLTRDVTDETMADAHGAGTLLDETIVVRYRPGAGRAVLTVVAGPEEDRLTLIVASSNQPARRVPLRVGETADVGNGLGLLVTDYFPRATTVTRPFVVPREQRARDAGEFFSQIRLEVEGGGRVGDGDPWISFHRYPFESPRRALRRFPFNPTVVTLPDGRAVEVLFSRQRHRLPAPIVLEDFRLATHIGGFTGETLTIRNYTSEVRFLDEAGDGWSAPIAVSVNDPISRDGWWFFQAQWDPPDDARTQGARASAGLNYTVLGVGNREGVYIQLWGCIIAVLGMIYAFYIKPVVKRRREATVAARIEAGEFGADARRRARQRSAAPMAVGAVADRDGA